MFPFLHEFIDLLFFLYWTMAVYACARLLLIPFQQGVIRREAWNGYAPALTHCLIIVLSLGGVVLILGLGLWTTLTVSNAHRALPTNNRPAW